MVDDEPIEKNVEDNHKDTNNNPADQGEEVNEADDPPENENEVLTLADEAEIEELPDALAAQPGQRRQKNQNVVQDESQHQWRALNRHSQERNMQRQLQQQ